MSGISKQYDLCSLIIIHVFFIIFENQKPLFIYFFIEINKSKNFQPGSYATTYLGPENFYVYTTNEEAQPHISAFIPLNYEIVYIQGTCGK